MNQAISTYLDSCKQEYSYTQKRRPILRSLVWVSAMEQRAVARLRGLLLKFRLCMAGGRVGKRLTAGRGVQLSLGRDASCLVGDRVSVGNGVLLSVAKGANLTIGDDVRIMHYTIIGAEQSIIVRDRAQIGEHCSIRDHEHDITTSSMHAAPIVCSSVSIGVDSWIGRGVAILKGAVVGPGAVVGANAVVRDNIPQCAVAVGIPARIVRMRETRRFSAEPGDRSL